MTSYSEFEIEQFGKDHIHIQRNANTNLVKIEGQWLTESDKGRRVVYVPSHAQGDASHADCEVGVLMHWNTYGAMVDYGRNKCRTCFEHLRFIKP